MFFICILLCITVTQGMDFIPTDNNNDVVHFYARFNASGDFIVRDCFAGRANYKFKRNQPVKVIFFSDRAIAYSIKRCEVFNYYYYAHSSTEIRDNMNGIYKTEINLSNIGDKHFDLKCYFNDNFKQTYCRTRVTITDIEKEDPGIHDLTGHTMIEMIMNNYDYKKHNASILPTRDVGYYDNSSMSIICGTPEEYFMSDMSDMSGVDYFTITRKAENGTILEVSNDVVVSIAYFINRLDESFSNNEFYCVMTTLFSKKTKEIAKVKLKYHPSGSGDLQVISKQKIIAIISGVLILFVFMVTLCFYLWYRVTTVKRNNENQKYYGRRTSTDDIYENPYDVVYEDRVKMQRMIKKTASIDTTRPPPPPIDTIPQKISSEWTRASTTPNAGSLIAESDLYLLRIDSDGYEIPIQDRVKYIQCDIEMT